MDAIIACVDEFTRNENYWLSIYAMSVVEVSYAHSVLRSTAQGESWKFTSFVNIEMKLWLMKK